MITVIYTPAGSGKITNINTSGAPSTLIPAIVADAGAFVFQVADGSTGAYAPFIGWYYGTDGFVQDIADAVHFGGGGGEPVTPTVATVSAGSAIEGSAVAQTVTLTSIAIADTLYAFTLGGGTATPNADYNPVPALSAGVTISGANLSVPAGVTSFIVTTTTVDNSIQETPETFLLTVGGVTGIGTITDNDNPPVVQSVSSATAVEGSVLVHTVTLSYPTAIPVQYAFTIGGGTATSGVDYTVPPTFSNGVTLSGGTLTVPTGVNAFTATVASLSDGATEGDETYDLTVTSVTGVGTITNSGGGPIGNYLTVNANGDWLTVNANGDWLQLS